MAAEDPVDALAQDPLSLAVNDAHGQDAPFDAGRKVVVEQVRDLPGLEGVQVESVGDGKKRQVP